MFGIYHYGQNRLKFKKAILRSLGIEAMTRGDHATGIAFNWNDNMVIRKSPIPATQFDYKVPDAARAIMGHTRHATKGHQSKNYNNHPFKGFFREEAGKEPFAMAHNGMLWNDYLLQKEDGIPETHIETDSYAIVQLLEREGSVNHETLKNTAEQLEGMFTLTFLDKRDHLHIVKYNNPFYMVHFPKYHLYVYGSTEAIVARAVNKVVQLRQEALEGAFTEMEPAKGDIWTITPEGTIEKSTFTPEAQLKESKWSGYNDEWDYGYGTGGYMRSGEYNRYYTPPKSFYKSNNKLGDEEYYNLLIDAIQSKGYKISDIELLEDYGYDVEEIWELVYRDELDDIITEAREFFIEEYRAMSREMKKQQGIVN